MIEIFKTNIVTKKLENINTVEKGCWINIVKPNKEEIEYISSKLNVSEQLLTYPLDIQEKPHIDEDEGSVLIDIDVPFTEYKDDKRTYTTIPMGMILVRDDYFITVASEKIDVLNSIINYKKRMDVYTEKKSRLVFQLLYNISKEYIKYMSYISSDIEEFENTMSKSKKHKDLLKLLDLEKAMIYFSTSLKANHVVLQKLQRGKNIKLYEEDEDLLEDTLIESRQAIEMIVTYSEILNGIIDICGTIISNNLNVVMKILTSITLIIAIPTLITSFLGMNVNFPFDTGNMGFYFVLGIIVISTIAVTLLLKKKDMM